MSNETFLGFPVKHVDKIEGMPDKVTMVIGTPSDILKFPIQAGDLGPLPPGVRIDIAHAHHLHGLVCAHKPQRVLEFGFGGGRSAEAILRGLEFNRQASAYTLVDSWVDWSGVMPEEADCFLAQHPQIRCVVMPEERFVSRCSEQFDFIMSDADHFHTHEWFDAVYDRLLAPGGILVYHDCRSFPGIASIVEACDQRGLRHVVFDRNSRDGEACQRGLLCIFKPLE